MKKSSITLSTLLIVTSSLYAITGQEVINQLSPAASRFGTNALNPTKQVTEQNASLNTWNKEFDKAKAFVIENSKNLVGIKDSDIIAAMTAVEKANMDIINSIKIIRGIGLQNKQGLNTQRSQLATIKRSLRAATDKLFVIKMTLSKKQEAKAVVLSIGRFLEQIIQGVDTMLATQTE